MSDPSGSREGSNLDEGSSASGSFSELDIRWATRALDRLGVVGREDLESALTSLVEAKVAGNFLKPPRRWGWHLISSALFFAFLLVPQRILSQGQQVLPIRSHEEFLLSS